MENELVTEHLLENKMCVWMWTHALVSPPLVPLALAEWADEHPCSRWDAGSCSPCTATRCVVWKGRAGHTTTMQESESQQITITFHLATGSPWAAFPHAGALRTLSSWWHTPAIPESGAEGAVGPQGELCVQWETLLKVTVTITRGKCQRWPFHSTSTQPQTHVHILEPQKQKTNRSDFFF